MNEQPATRDSIQSLIEDNPGIHFREIQRRLGLAVGQVEYHLYQLEKDNLIVSREDGKVKRYFSISTGSYSERQVIFYLRSNNGRDILQRLVHEETVPLEKLLRVRKSRLERRQRIIDEMTSDRVIELIENDGKKYVRIRDLSHVLETVRQYRDNFIDTLSDSFMSLIDNED